MKKILVGKVYANWCGHCQTLKPEWVKMKKELKSKMKNMGYHIQFVEIEESEQNKLTNFKNKFPDLNVSGYPTIFKHTGGALEYYKGGRTADAMTAWALGEKNQPKKHFFTGGKTRRKSRKSGTRKIK
jgi:thiol-disulfide isomerase/thioredoxin